MKTCQIIPTALIIDPCPFSCGDGGDEFLVTCEEVPGVAAFVDDVGVTVEHGDGELVGPKVVPDVFDHCPAGHVYMPERWD